MAERLESIRLVFSPQLTPEELAQWLGQTLRDIDFQPLKGTSVELANVGSIRMYAEAGAGFEKGVGSQQIISVFTFTSPLKQNLRSSRSQTFKVGKEHLVTIARFT